MRDHEVALAWAAGFFEGEGSVTAPGGRATSQIKNNDPEPLHRFCEVVQAGKVYGPYVDHKRKGKAKPFFFWIAQGHQAIAVVVSIAPWLSRRRTGQALDMLARVRGPAEHRADEAYAFLRSIRAEDSRF